MLESVSLSAITVHPYFCSTVWFRLVPMQDLILQAIWMYRQHWCTGQEGKYSEDQKHSSAGAELFVLVIWSGNCTSFGGNTSVSYQTLKRLGIVLSQKVIAGGKKRQNWVSMESVLRAAAITCPSHGAAWLLVPFVPCYCQDTVSDLWSSVISLNLFHYGYWIAALKW